MDRNSEMADGNDLENSELCKWLVMLSVHILLFCFSDHMPKVDCSCEGFLCEKVMWECAECCMWSEVSSRLPTYWVQYPPLSR
jgi:hypothetical protein